MLTLNERGLIPAIIQDGDTGDVLMMAYMSEASLQRTLKEKVVWFYSRSRSSLWRKGETSGHELTVRQVFVDCDADAILIKVDPVESACHTGKPNCFFTELSTSTIGFEPSAVGSGILEELYAVIQDRKVNPQSTSYTSSLLSSGRGRIAQKVVEEAGEAVVAALQDNRENLAAEVSDLLYHVLVLLADTDVAPSSIWAILSERRKSSLETQ